MKMIFGNLNQYRGKPIGDYIIIQGIGEGRYGVCFLAEIDGERVVLKRFKPHPFQRNSEKNFYETQILSQLCHPGIPKLLAVINERDFYGLVLEKKDGAPIETMLFKQRHVFTGHEIFNIGRQLIEIIQYLHTQGIVHRDIRIPNVLIDGDTVSLVDFGLARWEDDKRYTRDIDFSYLGDLLLYLLYSSYRKTKRKSRPWYEELSLTSQQQLFLKRLLKLEKPFQEIDQVFDDFNSVFNQ